ncbi:hypothetical protein [Pelagicoccus sp. SDUM812003]|uniref:hypothetical protein n=1 Tax=Pelagicoccus sp. SDUM812003 TaxID=3041267 RepID=UPI0028103EE3|nr:hypothetical protein [Pelagicoccus sp. SDUM812003]MDQ8204034.1 hypothetical protein [Pelagicoccus sp. SDUM812003]
MKTPFRNSLALISLACATFGASHLFAAEKRDKLPPRTTAHSTLSDSYKRERLPNGQWKTEYYAFGFGEMIDPTREDDSLTALSREDMARIIARALLEENYVPAVDPKKTDLLIMINWGKTVPYSKGLVTESTKGIADAINEIAMVNYAVMVSDETGEGELTVEQEGQLNQIDDKVSISLLQQSLSEFRTRRVNEHNARLLGYAPTMAALYRSDPRVGAQRGILEDLEDEIESERYFVILQAFDFQELLKNKKKNLLWVTRFSIRSKGRSFDEELAEMARAASGSFGQNSGKLRRRLMPGDISMGEIEMVEMNEEDLPTSSE